MKVTVVPAQVTTVEDRIAGNLSFSQLMLLAFPVFVGSALFVVLPPLYKSALYKLILIGALFIVCSLLAIRIKEKLVLFWLITLLRYNLRPRYYTFNKRSLAGRQNYFAEVEVESEPVAPAIKENTSPTQAFSTSDMITLSNLMEHPDANLSFETKKGALYVRITEVPQEN
jgi:hypothetical protein